MAKFIVGLLLGVGLTLVFYETYPDGIAEAAHDISQLIAANTP